PWGGRAVLWLGGEIVDDHEHTAARVVADDARLPALHEACARRRITSFSYHGRARTVHPYGLAARSGFWYLICHDTGRDAVARYRLDRIEDEPRFSDSDSFDRPAGIVLEDLFARDAKLFDGGDDEHAIVRVEGRLAPGVIRELGEEAVRARLTDGSVEVRVPCGNRFAFRNWLFAMVDRAEVLAPEDLRAEIVAALESLAGVAG
ncbi:MAG: helix-turn-helix transcriptional regulator, partial [Actinomycetota bacterium]